MMKLKIGDQHVNVTEEDAIEVRDFCRLSSDSVLHHNRGEVMVRNDALPFAGTLTPDSDLRQQWFGSAVMRHPAKQHLPQLIHILRRLRDLGIAPGSTLLDVFGGSGSLMAACSPLYGGHDVAAVELAPHFIALQLRAWQHFQCTLEMQDVYDIPPGMFVSIQGDSRKLVEVLRDEGMREGEQVDALVTSPPYQDSLTDGNPKRKPEQVFKRLDKQARSRILPAYDITPQNIGNERGNKYLASMAQVWVGCVDVLRPGGILVCITRDCVKDGMRVPVGEQNRALIEAAGLVYLETEQWAVERLSFWRILQKKRAEGKGQTPVIINSESVQYFVKLEAVTA